LQGLRYQLLWYI